MVQLGMWSNFFIAQPEDSANIIGSKNVLLFWFAGLSILIIQNGYRKFALVANIEESFTYLSGLDNCTDDAACNLFLLPLVFLFNMLFNVIKFNIGFGYYW